MNCDRAEIGEQAQLFAQTEEPLFGAYRGIGIVPAWPPDGAEDDGVGAAADVHRGRRQRVTEGIDGDPTDGCLREREVVPESLGYRQERPARLADHLRADTVSRQEGERGRGHVTVPRMPPLRSTNALFRPATKARAEPSTTSVDTPRPEYVTDPTWMITFTSAMASAPEVSGLTR